jgi:hypothetical protein
MTTKQLNKELNRIIEEYCSADFRRAMKMSARKKFGRDYCKDLNAMREALLVLEENDLLDDYDTKACATSDKYNVSSTLMTAWQCAETYVITINRWNNEWDSVKRRRTWPEYNITYTLNL